MNINHIALWTSDLDRLVLFYTQLFQCKVSALYENKQKHFASYFLCFASGARLEIMRRTDISESVESNHIGFAHIAVSIGTKLKLDTFFEECKKSGIKTLSEPRTTGDGYYEAIIADPDENIIELVAIDNFTIAEAAENDLTDILYLQKCCYLSEAELYNDYSIKPLTYSLDEIKSDFEKQTIYKLTYESKIIASVRVYLEHGTCFIGKLIVDRNYQNMGFGKHLLRFLEEKYSSISRFELFTAHKSEKNLHLYKNLSYKPFKEAEMDGIRFVYLEKIIFIVSK